MVLFLKHLLGICVKSIQLCPTLCDPVNSSQPGFSVHGILQSRILECVVVPSSRRSSQPRDQTCLLTSPALTGRFFTTSTTWEALSDINCVCRYICLSVSNSAHRHTDTHMGMCVLSSDLSETSVRLSWQEVLSPCPRAAPSPSLPLPCTSCCLWTEGRDFIPLLETGTGWRPRGDK